MNYYNENDPKAAQWLKNLIVSGMLPPGDVDERSIEDVKASDLKGYTQHHFFAGIGGWSEALRLANWPTDRPVWTGSCPCQSFSVAGKGEGFKDPRHLWPVWFELIKECEPEFIFGEQVEAAIKHGWLDLVQDDLESESYACGAVVLPACSVGAPHLRQRLWFMAYRSGEGISQLNGGWQEPKGLNETARTSSLDDTRSVRCNKGRIRNNQWDEWIKSATISKDGGVADSNSDRCNKNRAIRPACKEQNNMPHSTISNMGNSQHNGLYRAQGDETKQSSNREKNRLSISGSSELYLANASRELLPDYWATNEFWGDADWLYCRDEKFRAIEPRTLPLAHGVQGRVVKIRGYGNAIVPQVAAEMIKAGMECLEGLHD